MAINLIARTAALPGSEDAAYDLLVAYGEHVLTMDGSDRFEVYRDRDNPLQLVVVEQYRDEEAFAEHLGDPENAVLNGKMAALAEGPSDLQFLV